MQADAAIVALPYSDSVAKQKAPSTLHVNDDLRPNTEGAVLFSEPPADSINSSAIASSELSDRSAVKSLLLDLPLKKHFLYPAAPLRP